MPHRIACIASPVSEQLFLGLDVGDSKTHFCLVGADRSVIDRGSFRTDRAGLIRTLGDRGRCLVALEAGSQSPWMSSELRRMGYEVIVADPRKAAALVKGQRKTDRRDAESLARIVSGMPEMLGRVHHRGEQAQADLAILRARDLLVRQRTSLVQFVRSSAKLAGVRLPSCSTSYFAVKVRDLIPELQRPAIYPLLETLEDLQRRIRAFERKVEELIETRYQVARRLMEIPGVGPLSALCFVLTVDDPGRFRRSREVGAWLGLVPRVQASGDHDPRLPISKAGDGVLRRLLTQCAHHILGRSKHDTDLRRYGDRLVRRGGAAAKRKAVVAVARKLAVLMHRLWTGGANYEPLHQASRA